MRIVDEYDNAILDEVIDLTKGRLVDYWIRKPGVAEVDFITKFEYEDDDFELVKKYIPESPEKIAELRLTELKKNLADTDYVVLKIAEGAATVDEYAETIANRQAWRKEINELEEAAKR